MHWAQLLGPLSRSTETDLTAWFAELSQSAAQASSGEFAMLGGRLSATPGLAFFAGYQAALRALVPTAPAGIGAFCLTEKRSSKAADIHTQLQAGKITGQKDFVIAGNAAQWLLVIAREDAPQHPCPLRAVLVSTAHPNLRLQTGSALPLIPDIAHSHVQFDQVPCDILAGDGWQDYSKTFRTLEDGHVLAALCAWLYGHSLLDRWPQDLQLQLIALLAGLKESLQQPCNNPATHLLLASLIAQFARLQDPISQALTTYSSPDTALMWQRDKAVLDLATHARIRRLEVALSALALI